MQPTNQSATVASVGINSDDLSTFKFSHAPTRRVDTALALAAKRLQSTDADCFQIGIVATDHGLNQPVHDRVSSPHLLSILRTLRDLLVNGYSPTDPDAPSTLRSLALEVNSVSHPE